MTNPQGTESVWARLPASERRFILIAVVSGLVLICGVIVWWILGLFAGSQLSDGVLFLPLVVSVGVYAVLVGISVLLAVRAAGSEAGPQTLARLGAGWALASIPLMVDFLIDSFPGKLVINVLFVVAGIRYWKGVRTSYLSLFVAPLTALIAVTDGVGHLTGSFCSVGGALDSCPAKAVSDFYLVMLLVGVSAVTLAGRTERPDPRKLAIYSLILILIVAGFALAPF